MSVKVIGVGRSSGEFEGYKYDNFVLHCTEAAPKGWVGVRSFVAKVPQLVFNRDVSPLIDGNLDKLVGVPIDLSYNRFGKIDGVKIGRK